MKPAALTVFVFAVYLAVAGVLLMVMPGTLCGWFHLVPPGHYFWVRLSGMLMFRLALDFLRVAWPGPKDMLRWSVLTRQLTLPFLAAGVLVDGENPLILVFGVVDVAASVWTAWQLRGQPAAVSEQA